MKRNKTMALIAALLTLVILASCSAGTPPEDLTEEPPADASRQGVDADEQAALPAGQIYLYGEYHGDERMLNKELEHWGEHYHKDGMRHLFVELSYDSAEFLNIWMQEDSDDILDMVYDDWGESADSHNSAVYEFYKSIKREYPETVFHGTDIGHTYRNTAVRLFAYLEANDMEDSPQYALTQEAIEQGEYYHSNGNERTDEQYIFRENKMVENFIREFESLGGESVMGIYGAAHTGLDAMESETGAVPCVANQLRERYGAAVHSEDLTWLFNEPFRIDIISVNGKEYEASYFGRTNFTGGNFTFREFWRLENAYEDLKDIPGNGDEASGFFELDIEDGQVFVFDLGREDGSVDRYYYRSDGIETEDGPVLSGFFID